MRRRPAPDHDSGRTMRADWRLGRAQILAAGLLLLLLAACANGAEVTRVVEVTRLIPVSAQAEPGAEVTRLVVVTATPPPATPFVSADPENLQQAVVTGPRTLDPAQVADDASAVVARNVLETLVYPDPGNPGEFVPLLAARWQVEEEGSSYVFTLRRGVSFSNGAPLTATDAAYSLQRLLLQATAGGPSGLLLQPLLGYESGDVTAEVAGGAYAGDRAALVENTSEQERTAICERVLEAITADPEAGTVTLRLAQPWAPLPALLSQPWAGVVSQEWAVERGDWDGGCENWTAWYAPAVGETPLATAILGTGPYLLDHWTPGHEFVLTANNSYWRTNLDEMWAGGPAGRPRLQTIRIREVADPQLRWQQLQRGEVATAPLAPPVYPLAEQLAGEACLTSAAGCTAGPSPAGPLRRIGPLAQGGSLAVVFNFNITPGDNPHIGSGQLDGVGIPGSFFADALVRRAFAHCLDAEAYIHAVWNGEGAVAGSFLPPAWRPTPALAVAYDSQQCAEELEQAWGGVLLANGFRLQLPYVAGDREQMMAAALLQEQLQALNPAYQLEILGLPQAAYEQAFAERKLPLAFVRWQAPVADPHYQIAPLLDAEVEAFQRLPLPLFQNLNGLLAEGLAAPTLSSRRAAYEQLETVWQEELPFFPLPQPAQTRYEQRWLRGWFFHPEAAAPYYYAYWQQGAAE